MSDVKSQKLGMSFGTARARLDRDIMFHLAVASGHKCHRCDRELTRDTFSVEHKQPWMQQDDPKQAFFDLKNVAFSHIRCNSSATSRAGTTKYPEYAGRSRIPSAAANDAQRTYSPEKRREQYQRTGK